MAEQFELTGKYTTATIFLTREETNEKVIDQVQSFIDSPAAEYAERVCIMPDTHPGAGCVIGFTMKMNPEKFRVVPNIIGVDIGCGVTAIKIPLPDKQTTLTDADFAQLDRVVREVVPHGFKIHDRPVAFEAVAKHIGINPQHVVDAITDIATRTSVDARKSLRSIGTLGGGNHFIEIGAVTDNRTVENGKAENVKDTEDDKIIPDGNSLSDGKPLSDCLEYWLIVHSGSRNPGLRTAEFHQQIAYASNAGLEFIPTKNEIKKMERSRIRDRDRELGQLIREAKHTDRKFNDDDEVIIRDRFNEEHPSLGPVIPPETGLEYLEGDIAELYLNDMRACQEYARCNRATILARILERWLKVDIGTIIAKGDFIESVHNYIDFHDFTIRKGAIKAVVGETVIIPLSMGSGCVIGTGRSNPEWNNSAPHGAGRLFGRSQMFKRLKADPSLMEEFENRMDGIYSTCVNKSTIDESPMVYKDPEMIIHQLADTVDIQHILRPVYNFKSNQVSMYV